MRRAPKLTPFLNMLAGAAVLAGCNLSVDTSLIRQDAGDEWDGTDAGELVVESDLDGGREPEAEPEPEPELDAGKSEPDAKIAPEPVVDATVSVTDATVGVVLCNPESPIRGLDSCHPVEPPPPPPMPNPGCDDEKDCSAQQFCGNRCDVGPCAPSDSLRVCRARCSDSHGCVGPRVDTQDGVSMAAAAETVYWSTSPDRDSLGNPLNGGRIWSWRRGAPASEVSERESGELLLIADDYLYFRRPSALGAPPTLLFRKSLAGDSPATQLATEVVKAWKTPTHVVWVRKEGTSEELWSQSRTSATPAERIAVTQTGHWSSSNATLAIKSVETGGSVRHVVVRLMDQTEVGMVDLGDYGKNEKAVADEEYLYFQRSNEIRRAPFANLNQELILATGLMPGSVYFELDGSWLYWTGISEGSGRSQRDLMVSPPEKLVAAGPGTTRIKNELFYFRDRHIFTKAMTPLPCSPAMACPADMTCSASMVCQ